MNPKNWYFPLLLLFPLSLSGSEDVAFYWEKFHESRRIQEEGKYTGRERYTFVFRDDALFEDLVVPALSKKITNEAYFAWLDKYLETEEGYREFQFDPQLHLDLRTFDVTLKVDLLQQCLRKKSFLSRRAKHDLYAKLLASLHDELLSPEEYAELAKAHKRLFEKREEALRALIEDWNRKNPEKRLDGEMRIEKFILTDGLNSELLEAYKKARSEAGEVRFRMRRYDIVKWDLKVKLYPRFAILLSNKYYLNDPVGMIEFFELSKIPEKTHYKDLLAFLDAYCYRSNRITPEFRERYAEIMRERKKRKAESESSPKESEAKNELQKPKPQTPERASVNFL